VECHKPHHGPLACTACHQGNPSTRRENIAHHKIIPGRYASFRWPQSKRVQSGKERIQQLACRRCHIIAGRGNGLATELFFPLPDAKVKAMALSIRKPAQAMPDFYLSESDISAIVNALLNLSLDQNASSRERRRTVHFTKTSSGQTPFEQHCGPCHRMLSPRHGELGSGEAGPNLSGLMTRFYPSTESTSSEWTRQRLRRWIANPRSIKKNAGMPPVDVPSASMPSLLQNFLPEPSRP
jgi:cytochrome c2